MITVLTLAAYTGVGLAAVLIVAAVVYLIAHLSYERGYDRGLNEGYGHGERDGYREGSGDSDLIWAASQPTVDSHAARVLAIVAGPQTGSASFAEALRNGELRAGLADHEVQS